MLVSGWNRLNLVTLRQAIATSLWTAAGLLGVQPWIVSSLAAKGRHDWGLCPAAAQLVTAGFPTVLGESSTL